MSEKELIYLKDLVAFRDDLVNYPALKGEASWENLTP